MTTRILPLALLAFAAGALAQDNFRPANFDFEEDKRRLDKLIEFPEVTGDLSVMLLCASRIQSNGKMVDTGCYLQNNYEGPFAEAVNKAAKKARLNPAIVDGKAREVYLQFRVEFIAEKEERSIYFYLNPGYEENIKAYGFDHVAGQRVIGRNEPWNEACPKRAKFSVLAKAFLGEDGRADSPSLSHSQGVMPTPACQEAIKQTILQSRYTPAMADGYAVPSSFVEPFGN